MTTNHMQKGTNGTRIHVQPKRIDQKPKSSIRTRPARPATTLAVIVLVAAALANSSAQALDVTSPGPDWTEAYRKENLVLFTKDVGKAHEILAISELDVSPEVIFGVLRDFEHYPEFMPYVQESRVLSRASDLDVVTYARIAPPFVNERDYLLRVRMTRGSRLNGGVFKLQWASVPEAQAEIEGVVRVRLNEGSWVAEPLDGGKRTRLTYTVLTDPGGLIPPFVVDLSHTVSIPELFEAVRKRAEKGEVWK